MRWTGSGKIISDSKTIIYSGHDERHEFGVGIVLSDSAAKSLLGWKPVSDRIITARLLSKHAKTTIVQVHAPIEGSKDHEKDAFYEQLNDILDDIPKHDILIFMGDMNAKIGSDRRDAGTAWLVPMAPRQRQRRAFSLALQHA